jgi:Glycosyl hydrolases family 15
VGLHARRQGESTTQVPIPEHLRAGEGGVPQPFRTSHQAGGSYAHKGDAIRGEIEARGYNERIRSYTRTFDGEEMDASLLTLPLYGYIEGKHPRMRSTYASIHEELARDGLIYRYETGTDDGLPTGEGAFGICSFWAGWNAWPRVATWKEQHGRSNSSSLTRTTWTSSLRR